MTLATIKQKQKSKVIWQKSTSPTCHPRGREGINLILTPIMVFLDQQESACQTAPRSVHPFLRSSPVCPKHRHTDHATCDICRVRCGLLMFVVFSTAVGGRLHASALYRKADAKNIWLNRGTTDVQVSESVAL